MKPQERYEWIENYLTHKHQSIPDYRTNILDEDFVQAYIDATGTKFIHMYFGAHRCGQLTNDLANMAHKGILRRRRIGIQGMSGMSFPRWVWSYHLRRFE